MKGYYKLDNKILTFDVISDIDLIRFNHYIMKKENLQRVQSNELKNGSFYMTVRTVADDLKISNAKAQKIIKQFLEYGIIKAEKLSKSNNQASIYSYSVISESYFKTHSKTDESIDNSVIEWDLKETDYETSEKECFKSSCSCCEDKYIAKEDEKVSLIKKYGFELTDAQINLISTLDKDRLIEALNLSIAQGGKSFSYIYKVYSNNEKPKTNNISNTKNDKKNTNNKQNKNMKNKPIYMCSTKVKINDKLVDTNDLTEEEFEKLLIEKQNSRR